MVSESKLRTKPKAPRVHKSKRKSKNSAAVVLGHLGGIKGGPARAAKLSHQRRSEIASKAARARWARRGKNPK